jgi:hypothetical protein
MSNFLNIPGPHGVNSFGLLYANWNGRLFPSWYLKENPWERLMAAIFSRHFDLVRK